MKTLVTLLFVLIAGISAAETPVKRALIIAVGDYKPENYWGKISSEKDVPLIKKALLHHGFLDYNILLVQDAAATKQGIITAISNLTVSSKPGDIVVVHYSGHGQQVIDKNGDELDKRDESIVPIDAPAKYIKGVYEGERHLVDDELEMLFGELRMKLGPKGNLTLIFDACHSGTATRGPQDGMAKSRGTVEFMGPDTEGAVVKETSTYNFTVKTRGGDNKDIAPMVLFSGASAEELNYETQDDQGNYVGSLSYALSKVLLTSDKDFTYRQVFEKVKQEMSVLAPKQSPQVEGDLDFKIFGGAGTQRTPYFAVSSFLDAKTMVADGGQLVGLYDGSKVSIYLSGTSDIKNTKPITTGTVSNASLIKSDILLDAGITKDQAKNAMIVVTEQKFASISLKVKVDLKSSPELAKALEQELKQYPQVVKITDKNPDLVIEANNKYTRGNQLQVLTSYEQLIYNKQVGPNNEELAADITKTVLAFGQAKFLRDLKSEDSSIAVEFEIIPIAKVLETEEGNGRYKIKKMEEIERGKIEDYTKNGVLTLKEGDYFKLKITNKGTDLAYFTIIDVQPDDQINILVPSKNLPAKEFKIKPGETIELSTIFKIYPPFGMETFKLIASREPMDLSSIVTTRGVGTRGEKGSPFAELLKSTYKENTRGAGDAQESASIPAEEVNIFNQVFRIVENK